MFERPNQLERGPAPQQQEKKPKVVSCYHCNGTGKKQSSPCPHCSGSGKITILV